MLCTSVSLSLPDDGKGYTVDCEPGSRSLMVNRENLSSKEAMFWLNSSLLLHLLHSDNEGLTDCVDMMHPLCNTKQIHKLSGLLQLVH